MMRDRSRNPRDKKLRDFRRKRWSTREPYRQNAVVLSPRRAMRLQPACLIPSTDDR